MLSHFFLLLLWNSNSTELNWFNLMEQNQHQLWLCDCLFCLCILPMNTGTMTTLQFATVGARIVTTYHFTSHTIAAFVCLRRDFSFPMSIYRDSYIKDTRDHLTIIYFDRFLLLLFIFAFLMLILWWIRLIEILLFSVIIQNAHIITIDQTKSKSNHRIRSPKTFDNSFCSQNVRRRYRWPHAIQAGLGSSIRSLFQPMCHDN